MNAVKKTPFYWLALIFGVRGRVTRGVYAVVGFSLALFKYVVEATVLMGLTGLIFTPVDFLVPSVTLRNRFFEAAPEWLPWAMIVWSLPFVWVAATMTVRRCADAGTSQWWGLLVLLPVANILVMLTMAVLPSKKAIAIPDESDFKNRLDIQSEDRTVGRIMLSALIGVFIGGLFAVLVTALSVYVVESYGSALFMGMPIVSGTAAGFVYNQPSMRSLGASMVVGMISCLMGGLFLILFAMEGAVCLVMAVPIVAPLGLLGGLLGYAMAATILAQSKYMLGGALLLTVPLLAVCEQHWKRELPVYMAESSVIVDAPRTEVWKNVIAFPDITSPPEWYFRYGVASPLRARIEGQGIGAVRHCEFTTGNFVEPITIWDEPSRLAFDVTDQPEPLVEMTPYEHIHPPHLHGTFWSVRGEFELVELSENQTRLIGRTWYTIDMGPQIYWKQWTDFIIHRIHMRVLNHIQEVTATPAS